MGFWLFVQWALIIASVTYSVVSWLTAPRPGDGVKEEIKSQNSTYGKAIPKVYGTMRVAGNIVWGAYTGNMDFPNIKGASRTIGAPAGEYFIRRKVEVEDDLDVWQYFSTDTMIGLCGNPIAGILRVWIDNKLVWDVKQLAGRSEFREINDFEFRFILVTHGHIIPYGFNFPRNVKDLTKGWKDISVDAWRFIQYRHLTYAYIAGFALSEFGSRFPNIEFEISQTTTSIISKSAFYFNVMEDKNNLLHKYNMAGFMAGNHRAYVVGGRDSSGLVDEIIMLYGAVGTIATIAGTISRWGMIATLADRIENKTNPSDTGARENAAVVPLSVINYNQANIVADILVIGGWDGSRSLYPRLEYGAGELADRLVQWSEWDPVLFNDDGTDAIRVAVPDRITATSVVYLHSRLNAIEITAGNLIDNDEKDGLSDFYMIGGIVDGVVQRAIWVSRGENREDSGDGSVLPVFSEYLSDAGLGYISNVHSFWYIDKRGNHWLYVLGGAVYADSAGNNPSFNHKVWRAPLTKQGVTVSGRTYYYAKVGTFAEVSTISTEPGVCLFGYFLYERQDDQTDNDGATSTDIHNASIVVLGSGHSGGNVILFSSVDDGETWTQSDAIVVASDGSESTLPNYQITIEAGKGVDGSPLVLNGGRFVINRTLPTNVQLDFLSGNVYVLGGRRAGVPVTESYSVTGEKHGSISAQRGVADLADVVTDICADSGIDAADIDVTDLVGTTVDGYVINSLQSGREKLLPLQQAYFFDYVETGGKLVFRKRGRAAVRDIPETELGVRTLDLDNFNPDKGIIEQEDELSIPAEVYVSAFDKDNDYETIIAGATRDAGNSTRSETIDLKMAFDANKLKQVAQVLLEDAWLSAQKIKITVPFKYVYLDPGDTITITIKGVRYTIRIEKMMFTGVSPIELECVLEDLEIYSKQYSGLDYHKTNSKTPDLIPDTDYVFLDIPLLDAKFDGYGFYVVAAPAVNESQWHGAYVFRRDSGKGIDEKVATITHLGTMGRCTTVLGSASTSFTITLKAGSVASVTAEQVTEGANWAAVGMPGIGFEIVGFQTVTDNGDGTYTLSNLTRGIRGTEWMNDLHVSGEMFVLLDNPTWVPVKASDFGEHIPYAVVSRGIANRGTHFKYINYVWNNVARKPYAPINLTARKTTVKESFMGRVYDVGAWVIEWQPRNRADDIVEDYIYKVEFYNGSTLLGEQIVKVIYSADANPYFILPVTTYSFKDNKNVEWEIKGQDYYYGGNTSTITVKVYQAGVWYAGYGYPASGTFTA